MKARLMRTRGVSPGSSSQYAMLAHSSADRATDVAEKTPSFDFPRSVPVPARLSPDAMRRSWIKVWTVCVFAAPWTRFPGLHKCFGFFQGQAPRLRCAVARVSYQRHVRRVEAM